PPSCPVRPKSGHSAIVGVSLPINSLQCLTCASCGQLQQRYSQKCLTLVLYPAHADVDAGICAATARITVHYGLMPANFTTLAHFSVSSAINVPNSVGVIGIGSALRPLIRTLTCGSARPAAILLLSLSMIAAGVPLGAPMPIQPLASKPWTNSATAGKSGSSDERDALVTANGCSSPPLM